MGLRFNRSRAIRNAYRLYDAGRYAEVIAVCTRELKQPNADPELRVLRGVAYLDRDRPNEAAADWGVCCNDAHVSGVAHYHLGNLLAGQFVEHHKDAWEHFSQTVTLGWVEGHIGRGSMLLTEACRLRDEAGIAVPAADYKGGDLPEPVVACLREAIAEMTVGLTSSAAASKVRALSLRSSAYFNLGDLDACMRDATALRSPVAGVSVEDTDPRATGAELFW